MDNLFYNSIGRAKITYVKKIIWHMLKLGLLSVFLVIDKKVLKSEKNQLILVMFFGMLASIINAIVNAFILRVGYSNNSKNNKFFIKLAKSV